MALAEIIAGQAGHVNYDAIPNIVYTWPEVAAIGKTEEELKAAGISYKAGKFPFTANGRARAMNATEGFVKILADAKTDRVLGCHMVGPDTSHLIAEIAIAIEFGASSEDIARTCHGHPTLVGSGQGGGARRRRPRDPHVSDAMLTRSTLTRPGRGGGNLSPRRMFTLHLRAEG